MRTYLVTGGAGFIGSNYIHYMFRKYDNEVDEACNHRTSGVQIYFDLGF